MVAEISTRIDATGGGRACRIAGEETCALAGVVTDINYSPAGCSESLAARITRKAVAGKIRTGKCPAAPGDNEIGECGGVRIRDSEIGRHVK